MSCIRFIRIFAAVVWAFARVAAAEDGADLTLQTLNQYDEITIVFTQSSGMGHQATTKLVMNRLRELGYEGTFKIYIQEGVEEKVYPLLKGYDPHGAKEQILKELNATTHSFVPHPAHFSKVRNLNDASDAVPIKKLAIMGGNDISFRPKDVHADAVLMIQPERWSNPVLTFASDDGFTTYIYHMSDLLDQPLNNYVPHPQDPIRFIESEMSGTPAFQKKISGLQSMVREMGNLEMLTAYGVHFPGGEKKFATILNALARAYSSHPKMFKPKTIVPLLVDLEEEKFRELQASLEPNTRQRLKIVSIEDDVGAAIRTLKPKEILLVKTGKVSQDVWNYLIAKSTLPPLVNGATGANYAGKIGVPFINLEGNETYGVGEKARVKLRRINNALAVNDPSMIKNYFIDTRIPNGEVIQMFKEYAESTKGQTERVVSVFSHLNARNCFGGLLKKMHPSSKTNSVQKMVQKTKQIVRSIFQK